MEEVNMCGIMGEVIMCEDMGENWIERHADLREKVQDERRVRRVRPVEWWRKCVEWWRK